MKNKIIISTLSIILSLVIASIFIILVGKSPFIAFNALIKGSLGSTRAIANTLNKSVPIIIAGLACGFAFKGGMLNIGVEGQLHIGAVLAFIVSYYSPDYVPAFLVIILTIMASSIGGMIWGGIIGLLKVKLKINEVIIAILLNYIAIGFASYMINYPFISDARLPETNLINSKFRFPILIESTQFSLSIIVAIIGIIIMYFIISKTILGFKIRAVGDNQTSSEAGGIEVNKVIILTMMISGALGGLIGATELLGTYGKIFDGFSNNVGFTGLAVAVLAGNNPFGIILSGLLFGIMDSGSRLMSIKSGLSANMVIVIQGLVIFFIATPGIFQFINKRRFKK